MSDTLNDKTGDFKVGDKVVIEGVVSGIEASWNHPLKVTMKGINYGHFRPDQLRHAAPAPDASKRIEELEKQVADKQAHIQHLETKLSRRARVNTSLRLAIQDRNERIKELESDVDLLQDLLTFRSKPTCDTTCDSPNKCCNTKPAEPATTGDGVATDHIVEPNKMVVAPKGVKAEIVGVLDRINVRRTEDPCAVDYALVLAVDAIRSALGYIVDLPEPKGQIDFIRPDDVLCARIKTPVIIDGKVQSKCEAMLHLAADLIKAANGGAK
jgi:hypothetical protein